MHNFICQPAATYGTHIRMRVCHCPLRPLLVAMVISKLLYKRKLIRHIFTLNKHVILEKTTIFYVICRFTQGGFKKRGLEYEFQCFGTRTHTKNICLTLIVVNHVN